MIDRPQGLNTSIFSTHQILKTRPGFLCFIPCVSAFGPGSTQRGDGDMETPGGTFFDSTWAGKTAEAAVQAKNSA